MFSFFLVLFCWFCAAGGRWVKEMENKGEFEGDIHLDPDEYERKTRSTGSTYANIKGRLWPRAVVPYELKSSDFDAKAKAAIQEAIAEYHRYTCIRWVQRTSEWPYVLFNKRDAGCFARIGYRSNEINHISLAKGCLTKKGIIMHEMGHIVGLYHEQSRPDRDKYVNILWENIPIWARRNFKKSPKTNSLETPYDYESMMHYGSTAFGNGKITIQTKDPSKQKLLGNVKGFSQLDIKQINLLYDCASHRAFLPYKIKKPGTTIPKAIPKAAIKKPGTTIPKAIPKAAIKKPGTTIPKSIPKSAIKKPATTIPKAIPKALIKKPAPTIPKIIPKALIKKPATTITKGIPKAAIKKPGTTIPKAIPKAAKRIPQPKACVDKKKSCRKWARKRYCSRSPTYMKKNCCDSCCVDKDLDCDYHVSKGFCDSSRYGAWMTKNCKKSCGKC